MAYQCSICGKTRRVVNKISHSHIKNKRIQRPNLRRVRVLMEGQKVRIRICTRCLRSGKVEKVGETLIFLITYGHATFRQTSKETINHHHG